ncbi:hypothetical protein RAS12_30895 (plasmid) [Achromobacter seleniivolatilans]|uniref:ASCH domain-containing protein n=1 Tax=Achromobacter seleniivolatilans TaxID=3047478 RepID=A0ABY9MBM1_9BURK|nr:hypothetical protein [Achromobacter sp. R39]WMD24042.1 hypothetical protein RAS12_30895 [Achromobacter sp. R39]
MDDKFEGNTGINGDTLPPLDCPLAGLPSEVIYERLPSGAAGRAKIERTLLKSLPPNFYFHTGELIKTGQKGVTNLKLIGCEFRQARSGLRVGRWVIPIKGTQQTVVVTQEEIQAVQDAETAARLSDLRRITLVEYRQLVACGLENGHSCPVEIIEDMMSEYRELIRGSWLVGADAQYVINLLHADWIMNPPPIRDSDDLSHL